MLSRWSVAGYDDREVGGVDRDGSYGGEDGGDEQTHQADGDRQLKDRVPLGVLDHDVSDVALVEEVLHRVDELVARDLNLFHETVLSIGHVDRLLDSTAWHRFAVTPKEGTLGCSFLPVPSHREIDL